MKTKTIDSRRSRRGAGLARTACLLVIGAGLSACAGGGGIPTPLDGLPRLAVTEENRIRVSGDAAALRLVEDLTLDGTGRIYIVERGERSVRALDSSGEVLLTLGAGPDGALRLSVPQRIGWEDGRLWVFDRARYQTTYFDGAELVEQVTFPSFGLPDWEFPFVPVAPLPGRHAMAMPLVPQWVEGGRASVEYPVVRVGPEGVVRDTLWFETAGLREVEVVWPGGGAPAPLPQPFDDTPLRAFSWSDGSSVEVGHRVDPDPRMVVERTDADGRPIFRTEVPFRPDALTEDEIQAAVRDLADGWAERRPEPLSEIRQLFRRGLHIPPVRRPFQALLLAEDGRIWVRLTPMSSEGGLGPAPPHQVGLAPDRLAGDASGSRWLILSAPGTVEAWALLPPAFVPLWIEGERVVGVETDSAGEYTIVELRITSGS